MVFEFMEKEGDDELFLQEISKTAEVDLNQSETYN